MPRWVLFLVAGLLALAAPTPALADLSPYRLIGGVNGRYYWIDPAMINPAYAPVARNAVASWNATGTRISFSETTIWSQSAEDWYAKDYGSTGWRGATVPRDANGNGVVACIGCAPFANWAYAELSLNDFYLKEDCCVTRIQSTAAHEFGHGVALLHSGIESALMYADIFFRYDINGVYTPQQNDDIFYASQLQ